MQEVMRSHIYRGVYYVLRRRVLRVSVYRRIYLQRLAKAPGHVSFLIFFTTDDGTFKFYF